MSLDPNWLIVSMLISGIGTVLFLYGKKQTRLPHLLVGVVFVIYPYFIANLLLMVLIAAVLCVGLWLITKLGW